MQLTLGLKSICCLLLGVGSEEWDTSNWEVIRRVTGIAHLLCIEGFVLNAPKSFSLILKRLNYGLLSFMLLWKKIKFPPPLDARKTDGNFFYQNCFSQVMKWIFNRKLFWKVFALWKRSYRSGLNKNFILVNILCF